MVSRSVVGSNNTSTQVVFGALVAIGVLTLSALLVVQGGCAKPNYQSSQGDHSNSSPADGSEAQKTTQADCSLQFSNEGLCLTWQWEHIQESEEDFGQFTFKTFRRNLLDRSPVPVDLTNPEVELWMKMGDEPDLAHGSSPVTIERIDVGTYRAKEVFFSMHGEWELIFRGNGQRASTTYKW